MIIRILRFICDHKSASARPVEVLRIDTDSSKRLTKARVARLLARELPAYRRRKGRNARLAGAEVLPVLEEMNGGWRAFRWLTGTDEASGYEPPLSGRAGAINAKDNQFSDRSRGVWESAVITVVDGEKSEEERQPR